MKNALYLCASVLALCAINSSAVEGEVRAGTAAPHGGSRYGSGGGTWAEGTISSRGADGKISIRGSESPYANDYFSYHHDYYSSPDQRTQLGERYRDKFKYSRNDENLKDYSFTVPNYNDTVIYDEANYGTDYGTWKYSDDAKSYRYNDLNVGDRVVVGYDTNGNNVRSMYRLNAKGTAGTNRTTDENRVNKDAKTNVTNPNNASGTNRADNTRQNNTGTTDNTTPNNANSNQGRSNNGTPQNPK